VQAAAHIEAMACVMQLERVSIYSRRPEHLQPALAALELKLGAGERDELSALFPPTLGAAS